MATFKHACNKCKHSIPYLVHGDVALVGEALLFFGGRVWVVPMAREPYVQVSPRVLW